MNKIDEINALAEEFIALSDDEKDSKKIKYYNKVCDILFYDVLGGRTHPDRLNFRKTVISLDVFTDAFMYSWKKFCSETAMNRAKFFTLFLEKVGYKEKDEFNEKTKRDNREKSLDAEIGTGDDDSDGITLGDTLGENDREIKKIEDLSELQSFFDVFYNIYKNGTYNVGAYLYYTHDFVINTIVQRRSISRGINDMNKLIIEPCDTEYIRKVKKIKRKNEFDLYDICDAKNTDFVTENKLLKKDNTLKDKALSLYKSVRKDVVSNYKNDYQLLFSSAKAKYRAIFENDYVK